MLEEESEAVEELEIELMLRSPSGGMRRLSSGQFFYSTPLWSSSFHFIEYFKAQLILNNVP